MILWTKFSVIILNGSYPEWASQDGFEGFSHLVEDYSIEAINAKGAKCQEFLDRSSKLNPQNENYEIYKSIFQVKKITLQICLKLKVKCY